MRLVDLLASILGLVILSPLFLFVAVLVKLTSPGPVFHRALRVGKGGKPFRLRKFRSMVVDAARLGPGITTSADPRITTFGRFLRETKLDELPQLVNVFLGEMSLVGPRPEDPRYVALYTPEQRRVLSVSPGITSPASLRYRAEAALLTGDHWEQTYVERVLPGKLARELAYLDERSLLTDVRILVWTVLSFMDPRLGAEESPPAD